MPAKIFDIMSVLQKFDLTDKVAVVTGASKGIGLAIARALGEAGASVVVSSRKQEAIEQAAADLQKDGLQALPLACQVGEAASMQALVDNTVKALGGIDILVNNAATNPVFGPAIQTDSAAFDKIMQVNVKGPFELAKLVYPHMQARGGGSIINISSIGGLRPEPWLGIYSVSKAALLSLTQVLAKEWGADGIRVNAICPGLIKTKFSQALWQDEKILQRVMRQQPLAMLAEPEEVAGIALTLASPAGRFITGATYTVDGGLSV